MIRKRITEVTSISRNIAKEGEMLEQKIERILNNGEPITDGAPLMFTEKKDGVVPGYNVRTDRFEVAIEGMDKVTKSNIARSEEKALEREKIIKEAAEKQKGNEGGESGA